MILFWESVRRYYSAPLLSVSSIILLTGWAVALIVPFLFAFYTFGFWLEISSFTEQPVVSYRNKLILELEGLSADRQQYNRIQWSTDADYNRRYSSTSDRQPTVQITETDADGDSINDYLNFTLTVPMTAGETVQSVRLALFLNYKLQNYVQLAMQTLALLEYRDPMPVTQLSVTGDLRMKQRRLFKMDSANIQNNQPIINDWTVNLQDSLMETFWGHLVKTYYNRSEWTEFEYFPVAYTAGNGSAPALFKVTGLLRYSKQQFFYQPTAAEMFKWSWIQFAALFALCSVITVPLIGVLARARGMIATSSIEDSVKYHRLVSAPDAPKISGKTFRTYEF